MWKFFKRLKEGAGSTAGSVSTSSVADLRDKFYLEKVRSRDCSQLAYNSMENRIVYGSVVEYSSVEAYSQFLGGTAVSGVVGSMLPCSSDKSQTSLTQPAATLPHSMTTAMAGGT